MLAELGPLLELDQRVLDVPLFAHVPRIPGGELAVALLLTLKAVAALLIVAGLAGCRRRDVG